MNTKALRACMIVTLFCCVGLLFAPIADAACFSALANPMSKDVSQWTDLREFVPTNPGQGVKSFQRIQGGRGSTINLDYYELRFSKDPTVHIERFFRLLRRSFGVFADGGYGKGYGFHPYWGNIDGNQKKWDSPDPVGAMMTFQLMNYRPALALAATATAGGGVILVVKNGDVQVTCASSLDFIFTTIETDENGKHPVSGNRGFGLKDNGDGTWSFYTKATDRESTYWGNRVKDALFQSIFDSGHEFWLKFFANVGTMLDERGLSPRPLLVNRNPQPWQQSSRTEP